MRILHNGTVFDNQIGGADPRTRRTSVRFRSAGMPVDGRDAYSNHHVVGETVVQRDRRHDCIRAERRGDVLRSGRTLRLAGSDHALNICPHEPLPLASHVRTRGIGRAVGWRVPAVAIRGHFLSGRHPIEGGGWYPMGQNEEIQEG